VGYCIDLSEPAPDRGEAAAPPVIDTEAVEVQADDSNPPPAAT
jgi:hypothetical protein